MVTIALNFTSSPGTSYCSRANLSRMEYTKKPSVSPLGMQSQMGSPSSIKNHQQESQLFRHRAIIALLGIICIVLIIITRLCYLQVFQHQFYSTLSHQNLLMVIPVQPNRGLIYDRNGVLLAKNIPVYNLDIIPGRVHNLQATIDKLKKYIHLSDADLKSFRRNLHQYRRYQEVPLKINLSEQEVAKFYVNEYQFPGVSVQPNLLRYYPLGAAMSNVVGYVGRINATQLQKVDAKNYGPSDYIGQVGIEKYYEKQLHGKIGSQEAEIDASGRIVRVLREKPPTPGNTLYLTIDSRLQAYAEKLLGKENGAVVAIQPSTGQVLALVTHPNFDPNAFVSGMNAKEYHALLHSPGKPLFNRAIRGLFSPASTIKPFYALAGLSLGIVNPKKVMYDKGWFQLPNTKHIFHDWKHNGHGWVNLAKAIMVSCDTYFYNLAVDMGITRMDQILQAFGFGKKTGIDLPGELTGIVPSPDWKHAIRGKPLYTGDTIITGIGQGSLLVTPLQLAVATATLAQHGVHPKPHILLTTVNANAQAIAYPDTNYPPVELSNKNDWRTVIHAMEGVIRRPYGTAELFGRHPPYRVAAKTGTAQVFGKSRDEESSRLNLPKRLRNHHLFIAFAPIKNPQIAVAVVIEHSAYADRLTRKLLDFYFQHQKTAQQQVKHGKTSA